MRELELNLNTSQKLSLSQRMVLSAKILQMSSIELNDYLKELSQSNPLVEYDEKSPEDTRFDNLQKKLEWLDSGDEQNRYYYSEDKEDESENWNFKTAQSETLEEHLLSQINTQKMKKDIRIAAEFAAKSLDENGYLKESAETISALSGINKEDTEKAIALLKSLDPPGAGAKDLSECLTIQLQSEENPDMTAVEIAKNHLDALARNQLKGIAKKLGIPLDDVIEASRRIKRLNPKPSRGFSSNESLSYITPDAYIYKNAKGDYEITLNDYYSPSLRINGYYKTIVKSSDSTEAKEYISDKLHQAEWVIKCIDKRNNTLMSTLELIVEIQRDFFDSGAGNISPMKLMDISERLNIHESTVSRAVRDKYIQCSWGIFPLSYFFSSSVSKSDAKDGEISQDSVKLKIKDIIDGEDKCKPLSDRAVAELLEADGISISRRTVAKYREAMGIAGTSMRKKY